MRIERDLKVKLPDGRIVSTKLIAEKKVGLSIIALEEIEETDEFLSTVIGEPIFCIRKIDEDNEKDYDEIVQKISSLLPDEILSYGETFSGLGSGALRGENLTDFCPFH